MNYIHQLQGEVAELQAQREEANQLLTEVLVYLGSNKFWNDPTVQVRDIQTRLAPVRGALVGTSAWLNTSPSKEN